MTNSKLKLDRRDFLMAAGALGLVSICPSPVERLLEAMAASFINEARAAEDTALAPRNYFNIMLPGAPIRYAFDAWQRTSNSEPMLTPNPMVATQFGSVNPATPIYKTFSYNGMNVPTMFQQSVTTASGGSRPLTDLLDGMLVIRGYGTGMDGHPTNAVVQQSPLGGVSSIAGLAADYSSKTFGAIQYPDRTVWGSYFSSKGVSLNKLANVSGGPLKNMLEGFAAPTTAGASGIKNRNVAAFERAKTQLQTYANSRLPGAKTLSTNLSSALTLMKQGISDIDSYWAPAVARYQGVIDRAMQATNLPGVSDKPLHSDGSTAFKINAGAPWVDLDPSFDVRDIVKSMTSEFLAEGLALAEYVYTQNYVTSLEIFGGNNLFKSVRIKGVATNVGVATPFDGTYDIPFDMHECGSVPALLLSTAYFRGLSAGILALKDVLANKMLNGSSVWSNTVVQVTAEFNRAARAGGNGSDHGVNQMVTSIFSGAVKNGPYVVGNISTSGPGADYEGTQGLRAQIAGYTQAASSPAMQASTVAALLNVSKNPYQNLAPALVSLNSSGIITYPYGVGKLVGGE